MFASLILTPDILGTPGPQVGVFSNVVIPGLTDIYGFRVQFSGRTGGENMTVDIDNVNVSAFFLPEPGSLAMWGLGGAAAVALGVWRRRNASNGKA